MNIELYEGQGCHLYFTLNGDFEVYGGTTKKQFTVTKVDGEYLVTIPGQTNSLCYEPRFDIFARRKTTGQEWLLESGKITLKTRRSAEPTGAMSCVEYHITKELVESGETVDGGKMIIGIKGDSAYDIARANGYEGTEADYTKMVTDIPEHTKSAKESAEKAKESQNLAEQSKLAAETSEKNAAASAKAAEQSKLASEQAKTDSENARNAAKTSADNAAKSATDADASMKVAQASKLAAEQAKNDAQAAKDDAQVSATDAETAKVQAQTSERNAKASADAAAEDKTAAEKAKQDALAAQGKAEQEAQKATAAAEAAQDSVSLAERALPADFWRYDCCTSKADILALAGADETFANWNYPLKNVDLTTDNSPFTFNKKTTGKRLFIYSEVAQKGASKIVYGWAGEELVVCLPNKNGLIRHAFDSLDVNRFVLHAPNATKIFDYGFSFVKMKDFELISGMSYFKATEIWTYGRGYKFVEKFNAPFNQFASVQFADSNALVTVGSSFPMATVINFQEAKLDRASVLRIVNGLQNYDPATMTEVPTLTLGIDPSLDGDEEINAALLNAQAAVEDGGKGWNVAVNGFTITANPEAATLGLRRLVYAARSQDAEGCWVDSEGTRWRVRYGNTVLENWVANEQLGYEAFASLEDALVQWGLTEFVPEVPDEINTQEETV